MIESRKVATGQTTRAASAKAAAFYRNCADHFSKKYFTSQSPAATAAPCQRKCSSVQPRDSINVDGYFDFGHAGIHTRFHLEGERCSRLRSDPAKLADEFDVFRLSHLRRFEWDGRCTPWHATDRRREDAHCVRAFDVVCVENDNTGLHGNGFKGPRIRAACQERVQQTELLLNPAGGVCIRARSSREISLAEHGRMCFMDRI